MASRTLSATPDAIAWLAERVEGNLLAAAQEIDKLALLADGHALDVAALEASVADDARYDAFRLTDAAIGGDAGRALHIVAGLRAEGEEADSAARLDAESAARAATAVGGGIESRRRVPQRAHLAGARRPVSGAR